MTKTLAASVNELALLLFFWFIGVIIFGSIMYYLEYSEDSKFTSILQVHIQLPFHKDYNF